MATGTVERYGGGIPPGGPPVGDPFQRCLDRMTAGLAEIIEVPAWTLTEEQLVDRLSHALRVRAGVDEWWPGWWVRRWSVTWTDWPEPPHRPLASG